MRIYSYEELEKMIDESVEKIRELLKEIEELQNKISSLEDEDHNIKTVLESLIEDLNKREY